MIWSACVVGGTTIGAITCTEGRRGTCPTPQLAATVHRRAGKGVLSEQISHKIAEVKVEEPVLPSSLSLSLLGQEPSAAPAAGR